MARWTWLNVSSRGSDSIGEASEPGVQVVADIAFDGISRGSVECLLWKDTATGWIARSVSIGARPDLVADTGVRAKWRKLDQTQSDTTQIGDLVVPGLTVQGDLVLDNSLQGTFTLQIGMNGESLTQRSTFTGPFAPVF